MSNVALTTKPPQHDDFSFDEERERIHRQMLSSISHDLKTPLASMIGSLEVYARMSDALSPEKKATLIKVALQEAHRLDGFITNILDMAKLENGLVRAKQEDVEIGAMLRDCLTRMYPQLEDSAVDLQAATGTVKTVTDTVLLSRVVCLVLDNAVKYARTPSVIQIGYGKGGNGLGYIYIQDNGHGIPENYAEAIFSKYTRFGRDGNHAGGMGLGLAIAREIMQLLAGHITAANHADGGAVFTLHFPLK